MGRVLFPQGQQKVWVENLIRKNGLTASQLAILCGVNKRTFSDWRTGKFSIPEEVFEKFCYEFKLSRPEGIKVVPQYWYVAKGARKGALRRMELYGPLGTPEGRRKGGIVSQLRRRENPEYL